MRIKGECGGPDMSLPTRGAQRLEGELEVGNSGGTEGFVVKLSSEDAARLDGIQKSLDAITVLLSQSLQVKVVAA